MDLACNSAFLLRPTKPFLIDLLQIDRYAVIKKLTDHLLEVEVKLRGLHPIFTLREMNLNVFSQMMNQNPGESTTNLCSSTFAIPSIAG